MLVKVSQQYVTVFASSVKRLFFFFFAFCTCSCHEPLLHPMDLEHIQIFMGVLPCFHMSHSILKHQVSEYPLRPGHVNQVEDFFPYGGKLSECVPFQHSENMWYFIVHTVVILHSAYTMNTWDGTLVYCPFTSTWCWKRNDFARATMDSMEDYNLRLQTRWQHVIVQVIAQRWSGPEVQRFFERWISLDESTWCVVAITPCWCSLLFMTCQNPWLFFSSLKLMKLGILILAAYQVSTWTRWRKSCRCRFLGAVFMQNLFYLNSTYLECWDESREIQCLHNAGLRCFVVHQCIKVAIHLFEDVLGKHVNSVSITRQSLGPLGILHPLASWNASCFNPVQLLNTSDTSQAKRCQDTFNFVGFSPLLPWRVKHVQHTSLQCSPYHCLISKWPSAGGASFSSWINSMNSVIAWEAWNPH